MDMFEGVKVGFYIDHINKSVRVPNPNNELTMSDIGRVSLWMVATVGGRAALGLVILFFWRLFWSWIILINIKKFKLHYLFVNFPNGILCLLLD